MKKDAIDEFRIMHGLYAYYSGILNKVSIVAYCSVKLYQRGEDGGGGWEGGDEGGGWRGGKRGGGWGTPVVLSAAIKPHIIVPVIHPRYNIHVLMVPELNFYNISIFYNHN